MEEINDLKLRIKHLQDQLAQNGNEYQKLLDNYFLAKSEISDLNRQNKLLTEQYFKVVKSKSWKLFVLLTKPAKICLKKYRNLKSKF